MQNINADDTLNKYQDKMSHNRRVLALANAIIKRAKAAGIPDKYMRINQVEFTKLLDENYHSNISTLSDFVYKTPLKLLEKEFIVIDGGSVVGRKKAVFAILFRLIACDKYGEHWDSTNLSRQIRDGKINSDGLYRNDTISRLRVTDVVSIGDILLNDFPTTFDTGRFYDAFLSHRDDYVKTTILSFGNPINSKTSNSNWADQERFGQYVCSAAQSDVTNDSRFFRIRVKQ